jgi:hypothetical protein
MKLMAPDTFFSSEEYRLGRVQSEMRAEYKKSAYE